jgi:endonuclease/exonuclease/phosphatase family metal-dependent hydrolase
MSGLSWLERFVYTEEVRGSNPLGPTSMISVVSYNIFLGKKIEEIADWTASLKPIPNILCFQEFPEEKISYFLKKTDLNNYGFSFAKSLVKRGKVYGELTLYDLDKLKLWHSYNLTLGTSFMEKNFSLSGGERSALVTLLSFDKTKFVLVNIHLVMLALNAKRRKQTNKIFEYLDTLDLNPETPIILLGDFNYTSIAGQKRLLELMKKKGFTNAFIYPTHQRLILIQQIDYVFYKNCEVFEVNISKQNLSDHFPILFKLRI